MSAVLWGGLMVPWLGIGIAPYLVVQAIVGFSLLEVVNYMEHYGMLRQKVGVSGRKQRYEWVDPTHSWNSNNIATNVLLYHLQRHSDHHANPTRRYQSLRDYEESPAADRVRRDDRARHRPRRLAPGDGPAGARARRRRPEPGQPEPAQAGQDPREVPPARGRGRPRRDRVGRRRCPGSPSDEVMAARCPGCGYTYEVEAGDEHEGFAAGTAWADIPQSWCCPTAASARRSTPCR